MIMEETEKNTYLIQSNEYKTNVELIVYKELNRITISYKGVMKIRLLGQIYDGIKTLKDYHKYEIQILNISY